MEAPIVSCVICGCPLGQDSRDSGFAVCHEHRKCAKCNTAVSVNEAKLCLDNKSPITHARCMSLNDVGTLPLKLELLNITRLLNSTCMRVGEMSFEQKYEFLRELQAKASFISIEIRKDRVQLDKKRESDKKEQAKQEAITSSRPTNKSATDNNEQAIAWFMSTYNVERATALKELKNRDKAIMTLQKYGTPYESAVDTVRDQFDKKYRVGAYAPKQESIQ